MLYDYHFFGMHLIWWVFWVVLIFALFGWFEPVPKRRVRRDSPAEILKRRFASGEITEDEFRERLRIIDEAGTLWVRLERRRTKQWES